MATSSSLSLFRPFAAVCDGDVLLPLSHCCNCCFSVFLVFVLPRVSLAPYNLINVFMRFLVCMQRFIFGTEHTYIFGWFALCLDGDIDGYNECPDTHSPSLPLSLSVGSSLAFSENTARCLMVLLSESGNIAQITRNRPLFHLGIVSVYKWSMRCTHFVYFVCSPLCILNTFVCKSNHLNSGDVRRQQHHHGNDTH